MMNSSMVLKNWGFDEIYYFPPGIQIISCNVIICPFSFNYDHLGDNFIFHEIFKKEIIKYRSNLGNNF